MKIAMPVKEPMYGAEIWDTFADAPFFLIYDSVTDTREYLENDEATDPVESLLEEEISILVIENCGKDVVDAMNAAGVVLYRSKYNVAYDNLSALWTKELQPYGE